MFDKFKIPFLGRKKLEEALNEVMEELKNKNQQIAEFKNKLKGYEEKEGKLKAEKNQLLLDIERLKSENMRVYEKFEKTEKKCEFLEEELSSTKKSFYDLSQNLSGEREKNIEKTIEIGRLNELLSNLDKEKKSLLKDKENLSMELSQIKNEVESLKKISGEKEERIKILQKKIEHNRRAWLITQLQLDMAEDKIFLLTKGYPRPTKKTDHKDLNNKDLTRI